MRLLYKNIFTYIIFFVLFLAVNFLLAPLYCDEVWNFGFSYNIYSGLVPYRDFNVIVTPFYFILNAIFFKMFSPSVFVMHVISAISATISLYFISKVNQKSFYFVYIFFVMIGIGVYTPLFPNYNLFSLYLFIIIFALNYEKKSPFLIGLFTGILFTIKQSIGIFVFIPILFDMFKNFKDFLKEIIGFIIPIIFLVFYLIFNNAFFDFINYCFLGLFDFSSNNGRYGIIFLVEIFIVLILIKNMISNKDDFKSYLYLLCFQIVTFPIFDLGHFIIGFIPVIVFFTRNCGLNKFFKYAFLFVIIFLGLRIFSDLHHNDSKYFRYRNFDSKTILYFHEISEYMISNSEEYDVHFISSYAYFLKLENDMPIDDFDLLFYGNLGYDGYNRYISKINDNDKNILFIIDDEEYLLNQLHNGIIEYIVENSVVIDNINGYNVYKFEVSV